MSNKKSKIFVIVSVIFLLTLIVVYGYRLVCYYKLEHPKVAKNANLIEKITNLGNVVNNGDGLYLEKENYYFKGKNVNNYLYYSGLLWRIVSINQNNIKLVTDDNVTSIVWGYDTNDFNNSYINEWLNKTDVANTGIFINSLDSGYIEQNETCIDTITDLKNYECNKKSSAKIGLISISEYRKAGGENSYLNTNSYWWTSNSSDKSIWFVRNDGNLSDGASLGDTYYSYGVRPTINIKGDINKFEGTGTKNDPYIIKSINQNSLYDAYIGQYINYSNYVWRVVDKDETKVKVVLDGFIKDNDNDILKSFSESVSEFNVGRTSNIGYYLNNDFYNSLNNKDYIVTGEWHIGQYSNETKYDYKNIYSKQVTANIGLLHVGELFVNDYSDYSTLTFSNDFEETVYTIQSKGLLYSDLITTEKKVRPSLYLDKNLKITAGNGMQKTPFVVSK